MFWMSVKKIIPITEISNEVSTFKKIKGKKIEYKFKKSLIKFDYRETYIIRLRKISSFVRYITCDYT